MKNLKVKKTNTKTGVSVEMTMPEPIWEKIISGRYREADVRWELAEKIEATPKEESSVKDERKLVSKAKKKTDGNSVSDK